jgi:hypothetical protein
MDTPECREPKWEGRRFSTYGLTPVIYSALFPIIVFLAALLIGTLLYHCAGNAPYNPGH